jgi:hypothetical protein
VHLLLSVSVSALSSSFYQLLSIVPIQAFGCVIRLLGPGRITVNELDAAPSDDLKLTASRANYNQRRPTGMSFKSEHNFHWSAFILHRLANKQACHKKQADSQAGTVSPLLMMARLVNDRKNFLYFTSALRHWEYLR